MPDTWHIWTSSLQNPRATLSWTLREKLIHAQRLTVMPLIIFCARENHKSDSKTSWEIGIGIFISPRKKRKSTVNLTYTRKATLFIIFHCPTWGKQTFSFPVSWYFNCIHEMQFKEYGRTIFQVTNKFFAKNYPRSWQNSCLHGS